MTSHDSRFSWLLPVAVLVIVTALALSFVKCDPSASGKYLNSGEAGNIDRAPVDSSIDSTSQPIRSLDDSQSTSAGEGIRFVLVNDAGVRLPGGKISLWDDYGAMLASGLTADADGVVVFQESGDIPSHWAAEAESVAGIASGCGVLTESALAEGNEITLRLVRGAQALGVKVSRSGAPLEGAPVTFSFGRRSRAVTDHTGVALVSDVGRSAGEVYVGERDSRWAAKPLELIGPEMRWVFLAVGDWDVRVRVVDRDSGAASGVGLRVFLAMVGEDPLVRRPRSARVGPDGSAEFVGISDGHYEVSLGLWSDRDGDLGPAFTRIQVEGGDSEGRLVVGPPAFLRLVVLDRNQGLPQSVSGYLISTSGAVAGPASGRYRFLGYGQEVVPIPAEPVRLALRSKTHGVAVVDLKAAAGEVLDLEATLDAVGAGLTVNWRDDGIGVLDCIAIYNSAGEIAWRQNLQAQIVHANLQEGAPNPISHESYRVPALPLGHYQVCAILDRTVVARVEIEHVGEGHVWLE